MNRIQNESFICKCTENADSNTWKCQIKHEYKQKNGWIKHMPDALSRIFNKNGTSVGIINPSLQKDGRNYNHLILLDWMTGDFVKLTEGQFVVTKILANDERLGKFYFTGNKENNPGVRHLYSVDTGGKNNIICLTCDLKVS